MSRDRKSPPPPARNPAYCRAFERLSVALEKQQDVDPPELFHKIDKLRRALFGGLMDQIDSARHAQPPRRGA